MVEIVDDADVGDAGGGEVLDDLDLVLGFAEPSAVIVETDGALEALGGFGDGTDALGFEFDSSALFGGGAGGLTAASDPELGAGLGSFQDGENKARLVVQFSGKPPGSEVDAPGAAGGDLGLETRNMFRAIIVGELGDAQSLEHPGTILGTTLLGIKRYDTPRHEVGAREEGGVGGVGQGDGRETSGQHRVCQRTEPTNPVAGQR